MQKTQEQSIRMFGSVVSYVDAHPELVADTPQGRAIAARVAALRSIINAAHGASSWQQTAKSQTRVEDGKEPELKRQLREAHLRSIAMVARGLSATVPGIGLLRMPSANLRNATLIDRANAFAQQARIYQSVLTEHGLADNAIDKLQEAINAFSDSVNGRRAARTALVGATHAVRDHVATGRNIVIALDGVIRNLFDGRDDALKAWESAKRIDRAPRGSGSLPYGLFLPVAKSPTAAAPTRPSVAQTAPSVAQTPSSAAQTGSSVAQTPSSLAQTGARAGEAPVSATPSGAGEVKSAA